MRDILNIAGYSLLSLCLILTLADFACYDSHAPHHLVSSPAECSDTSGQTDQSHSDCTGDEVIARSLKGRPGVFPEIIGVFHEWADPVTITCSASIWQPPRLV